MDSFFIEYHDPLFGIIVILFFIFFVSFLTYTFGQYQDKQERRAYKKLLKRFQLQELKNDDYKQLTQNSILPYDTILILASSYIQQGNYEKAISIYLMMLDNTKDINKKEEILEHLGMAYFKGGFLQRSEEIFLKIVEFSPRNHNALYQLLYIYEKLAKYTLALEIIDSINELELKLNNVYDTKIYLNALQIANDPLKTNQIKAKELITILKHNHKINRLVAKFILYNEIDYFWKNIHLFNILELIDLLWYIPKEKINFDIVNNNQQLKEIFVAKNYIQEDIQSNDFELSVLIELNKTNNIKADLGFEYLCNNCKHSFPMSFDRCPNCHSILNIKIQKTLMKVHDENNNSLF